MQKKYRKVFQSQQEKIVQEPIDVNQLVDQILDVMIADQQKAVRNKKFQKSEAQYLVSLIEMKELEELEKIWKSANNSVSMVQFVKIFLQIIKHESDEMLFMVMGLIELLEGLQSQKENVQQEIQLQDVTTYICSQQETAEGTQREIIEQRRVPEPTKFYLNKDRVRQIDIDAPRIHSHQEELLRLDQSQNFTDSMHHQNGIQQGVYIDDLQSLVTLDSLGTRLNVYNLQCQLKYHIKQSQSTDPDRDAIILGFAYSSRQERIGMATKAYQLCFYDMPDFNYAKGFQTLSISSEIQNDIWYLPSYDAWMTTDSTCRLYQWDLTEENISRTFKTQKLTQPIITIEEIVHLKLLATASLDRQIIIWDWNKLSVVQAVSMIEYGGVHSLIYSYWYQVLIACGYSKTIGVYEIDHKYLDCNNAGMLQGHTSMISSITMVGQTPVLCSGDDCGIIKLWDIRTVVCLQTLSFGKRTQILQLIDISSDGLICFLGSRVNMVPIINNRNKVKEPLNPIRVDFNPQNGELYFVCQREIQVISIYTGRAIRILADFLEEPEDEIISMRPLQHFQRFVCCDSRGNTQIYSLVTGQRLTDLKGIQGVEVKQIHLDFNNNLIISTGDGTILVQKETQGIIRQFKGLFEGKDINHLEHSITHNILVVTYGNRALFLDYELFRVLCELNAPSEITTLVFLNFTNIICIGTENGLVYIFDFHVRERVEMNLQLLAVIDVRKILKQEPIFQEDQYQSSKRNSVLQSEQNITNSKRNSLKTQSVFSQTQVQFEEKVEKLEKNQSNVPENLQYNLMEQAKSMYQRDDTLTIQKLLILQNEKNLESTELFIGLTRGEIIQVNLDALSLFQVRTVEPAFLKLNYNPYRQTSENYATQGQIHTYEITNILTNQWQNILCLTPASVKLYFKAQRTKLQYMTFILLDEKVILSIGADGRVAIHKTSDGNQIGSLNLNHPLPTKWEIQFSKRSQLRKKVVYALKIIEILQKNGINFNPNDLQKFTVSIKAQKTLTELPQIKDIKKNIILMPDEYTPRELDYKGLRHMYQNELQGLSLKQMDQYKRLQEVQNAWKSQLQAELEQEKKFQQLELEKQKAIDKRTGSIAFLDIMYHDRLSGNFKIRMDDNQLPYEVQLLSKKMSKEKVEEEDKKILQDKIINPIKNNNQNSNTQLQLNLSQNQPHRKISRISLRTIQKSNIDFLEYAGTKNLTLNQSQSVSKLVSSRSTTLNNSITDGGAKFKPSFFSQNPEYIEELHKNVQSSKEWMNMVKNHKNQLHNVLINLNKNIMVSKNSKYDKINKSILKNTQGISIISEQSQFGFESTEEKSLTTGRRQLNDAHIQNNTSGILSKNRDYSHISVKFK